MIEKHGVVKDEGELPQDLEKAATDKSGEDLLSRMADSAAYKHKRRDEPVTKGFAGFPFDNAGKK